MGYECWFSYLQGKYTFLHELCSQPPVYILKVFVALLTGESMLEGSRVEAVAYSSTSVSVW